MFRNLSVSEGGILETAFLPYSHLQLGETPYRLEPVFGVSYSTPLRVKSVSYDAAPGTVG